MTGWNPADLAAIDREGEIRVASHRPDGTLRSQRIIWHVVVDGALFVRSVRGADGAWYRGVQSTGTGVLETGGSGAGDRRVEVTFTPDAGHNAAIDRAYHAKYGDGPHVAAITSPEATATTLRLDPA